MVALNLCQCRGVQDSAQKSRLMIGPDFPSLASHWSRGLIELGLNTHMPMQLGKVLKIYSLPSSSVQNTKNWIKDIHWWPVTQTDIFSIYRHLGMTLLISGTSLLALLTDINFLGQYQLTFLDKIKVINN